MKVLVCLLALCVLVSAHDDVTSLKRLRALRARVQEDLLPADHSPWMGARADSKGGIGVLHPNYDRMRFVQALEGAGGSFGGYDDVADAVKKAFETRLGITAKDHATITGMEAEFSTVDESTRNNWFGLLGDLRTKCKAIDETKGQAVILPILQLLTAQNAGDPFHFVSHSQSHGIRVAQQGNKLVAAGVLDAMKGAYKETGEADTKTVARAECAQMIGSVLHDIGYAPAYMKAGATKFLHATNGANMINNFAPMASALDALFGSDTVRKAITGAIATHNYDTRELEGDKVVPNNGKPYKLNIAPGNAVKDKLEKIPDGVKVAPAQTVVKIAGQDVVATNAATGEVSYTRTYTPAEVNAEKSADKMGKTGSLQVIMRYADQMDAQRSRLTPYQQGEDFIAILGAMYKARIPFKDTKKWKVKNVYDCDGNKAAASPLPVIKNFKGTDNKATHEEIPKEVCSRDYFGSESFMHFYSNWMIQSVSVTQADGGLSMVVDLYPDLPGYETMYVALFQIVRASEAVFSLKFGGDRLTDKIKVSVTRAGTPVADFQNIPLRVFNAKSWDRSSAANCVADSDKFKALFKWDAAKGCFNEKLGGEAICQTWAMSHPSKEEINDSCPKCCTYAQVAALKKGEKPTGCTVCDTKSLKQSNEKFAKKISQDLK